MKKQIDVTEMHANDTCYRKLNMYVQKELTAFPLSAIEAGLEKLLLDLQKMKISLYIDVIAKQNAPKEECVKADDPEETLKKLRECGVKVTEE